MLKNDGYGLKTDLWSIGILYYQMLLGFTPFFFEDKNVSPLSVIMDNIDKIYDEKYQRFMFKRQEVSGSFQKLSKRTEEFLRKLIVINPKQRAGWKQLLEDEYLTKNIFSDDFYP